MLSFENAERIKREYGYAISSETSVDEFFPVETIGKKDPVKVDEHYSSRNHRSTCGSNL